MTDTMTAKPPLQFWIVSGLALVWNLLGVMQYIMQATMSDENFAKLPEAHQAALLAQPGWVTGVFALAVFGGALGCVLLLLRSKWAIWAFVVSFLAVLAQQTYIFMLSDVGASLSSGQLIMPLMIPIVAALLIVLARTGYARGWLK